MSEESSVGNKKWEGNNINIMSFKSRTTLLHFKKALEAVYFSYSLIYICQSVILNFIHHIVPAEHQKHFTEQQ